MFLLKRYLLASRADRLMNNSYGDHIVENGEEKRTQEYMKETIRMNQVIFNKTVVESLIWSK